MVAKLADSSNGHPRLPRDAGHPFVALMNKAGGSGFPSGGRSPSTPAPGAQLATFRAGSSSWTTCNRLTVGFEVMRPVTDRQKVPRQAGLPHRRHGGPGSASHAPVSSLRVAVGGPRRNLGSTDLSDVSAGTILHNYALPDAGTIFFSCSRAPTTAP